MSFACSSQKKTFPLPTRNMDILFTENPSQSILAFEMLSLLRSQLIDIIRRGKKGSDRNDVHIVCPLTIRTYPAMIWLCSTITDSTLYILAPGIVPWLWLYATLLLCYYMSITTYPLYVAVCFCVCSVVHDVAGRRRRWDSGRTSLTVVRETIQPQSSGNVRRRLGLAHTCAS